MTSSSSFAWNICSKNLKFANLWLRPDTCKATQLKRQIWTSMLNINISRVLSWLLGSINDQDPIWNKWELESIYGLMSKIFTILEMLVCAMGCWNQKRKSYAKPTKYQKIFTKINLLHKIISEISRAKATDFLGSNGTEHHVRRRRREKKKKENPPASFALLQFI